MFLLDFVSVAMEMRRCLEVKSATNFSAVAAAVNMTALVLIVEGTRASASVPEMEVLDGGCEDNF